MACLTAAPTSKLFDPIPTRNSPERFHHQDITRESVAKLAMTYFVFVKFLVHVGNILGQTDLSTNGFITKDLWTET